MPECGETAKRGTVAFPIALTAKISGATVHQLRYWYRQEILVPSVQSDRSPYLYSFHDVIALRSFAYLRSDSFSLAQIRRVLSSLRDLDMLEHPARYRLVVMGSTVAVHLDDGTTVDVLKVPGQTTVGTLKDVFGEFITKRERKVDDLYNPRPGIQIEPLRLGGWPTIAGTRVPYDEIAALLGDGSVSPANVSLYYPNVTVEAAAAALEYAREVEDLQRAA
jgi:uncharacterized protein (DUF433 family)